MPAFCRVIDSSDRPRLALAKNFSTGSLREAHPGPPLVCVIADLIGNEAASMWETDHRWISDHTKLLASLPTVQDSLWQPCPERLLPPVDHPEKVLCIGLNYLDHAIETGAEPPTEPIVFSKFNTALIGHGEPIVLPAISDRVDYEAELVVVIGQTARNVSTDQAMSCIFGYTAGHDVSARDWQKGRPGGQWLLAKSFDTFGPIGPCVVTADEIPNAGDVRVRMHLNGDTVQDSTTAQLIFGIADLIAHLSKVMTLRPGDLVFTGTPPGVGAARTPPRYLASGDVCSVEIDFIGELTNPCITETH